MAGPGTVPANRAPHKQGKHPRNMFLKGKTVYIDTLANSREEEELRRIVLRYHGQIEPFLGEPVHYWITATKARLKDIWNKCQQAAIPPKPSAAAVSNSDKPTSSKETISASRPSIPMKKPSFVIPESMKNRIRDEKTRLIAAEDFLAKAEKYKAKYGNPDPVDKPAGAVKRKSGTGLIFSHTGSQFPRTRSGTSGARRRLIPIKEPAIKIEYVNEEYRPVVHELQELPKLCVGYGGRGCAFERPKPEDLVKQAGAEGRKEKAVKPRKRKRIRRCELCNVHVDDVDDHMKTKGHIKKVEDPTTFALIDAVIAEEPPFSLILQSDLAAASSTGNDVAGPSSSLAAVNTVVSASAAGPSGQDRELQQSQASDTVLQSVIIPSNMPHRPAAAKPLLLGDGHRRQLQYKRVLPVKQRKVDRFAPPLKIVKNATKIANKSSVGSDPSPQEKGSTISYSQRKHHGNLGSNGQPGPVDDTKAETTTSDCHPESSSRRSSPILWQTREAAAGDQPASHDIAKSAVRQSPTAIKDPAEFTSSRVDPPRKTILLKPRRLQKDQQEEDVATVAPTPEDPNAEGAEAFGHRISGRNEEHRTPDAKAVPERRTSSNRSSKRIAQSGSTTPKSTARCSAE